MLCSIELFKFPVSTINTTFASRMKFKMAIQNSGTLPYSHLINTATFGKTPKDYLYKKTTFMQQEKY